MSEIASVIAQVCDGVRAQAALLNELDGYAGDGDLGVTMGIATGALLEALPTLDGKSLDESLRTCGMTVARVAPSTSGTLLATGLIRAAAAGTDHGSPAADFSALLEGACNGIAERGKAEIGSKTLLDALAPAVAAARTMRDADLPTAVRAAAAAADVGAAETVRMEPKHGRAGWLTERSMGHEDAGARLVAIVLDALARALAVRQSTSRAKPPNYD